MTYIDSSGVAVLLMARQFCAQQNIQLSLPSISSAVHRVLEIAKLDQILPIGQIVSSSDSGFMGVSDAQNETSAVSDDDLAAELLGGAPAAPARLPHPRRQRTPLQSLIHLLMMTALPSLWQLWLNLLTASGIRYG